MIIDLSQVHRHINPHFLPLLYDENRNLVLRGSAGSGKSHFIGQKFLIRILTDWNDVRHRILVLRKTLPSAKDSVLSLFKRYIYEWQLEPHIHSIISNPASIRFTNGAEILIRGLDDPEKVKSIEGVTSIWLEEANQFTQEDYDELSRRLRGNVGTYKQIVISFNPVSKYNWLYKHFYAIEQPNTTLHHSTFKDNKYIINDADYITTLEQYKNNSNNYNYLVYYKGEWGAKEGLIYTNWEPIDKWVSCDVVCYGIDYGFDAPTAVVKVGKTSRDSKDIYVELLMYKKGITNTELIEWLKTNLPSGARIFADSAEPDRILESRRAGVPVRPADKRPGSVNAGIDYLQAHRINILKNRLFSHIEEEITGYTYDENRDGSSKEKPGTKSPDHALDALRYPAYTYLSKNTDLSFITSGD